MPVELTVLAKSGVQPILHAQPGPIQIDPIKLVKLVIGIKKFSAVAFPEGPDYVPAID